MITTELQKRREKHRHHFDPEHLVSLGFCSAALRAVFYTKYWAQQGKVLLSSAHLNLPKVELEVIKALRIVLKQIPVKSIQPLPSGYHRGEILTPRIGHSSPSPPPPMEKYVTKKSSLLLLLQLKSMSNTLPVSNQCCAGRSQEAWRAPS